jgi:hypothetical protein
LQFNLLCNKYIIDLLKKYMRGQEFCYSNEVYGNYGLRLNFGP